MSLKKKIISDLSALKIVHKVSGENISDKCVGVNCPSCEDREFHMGIFVDKGNASCWRCGATFSYKKIVYQLAEKQGIARQAVTAILNTALPVTSEKEERRPSFASPLTDVSVIAIPFPYSFQYVSESSPDWVLEFLDSRNVAVETCEEYDIGYCTYGKQHDRLIIPVFYDDLLVSYQGRDTTGEHPVKYLTADGSINRFVFGINEVQDTAIITEGVFDAIRIGPPAICTFGTHITNNQLSLLLDKGVKNVILLWDSDAYIKGRRSIKKIQPFVDQIKLVRLPEGEDPDSLGKEKVLELISAAAWL